MEVRGKFTALWSGKRAGRPIVSAQDDRAMNLVAAGIGVALMPALFSGTSVSRVPVSDLPITRILVVRKKRKPKKTTEAIFQFLKEKDIRYL
jgi:DNA-binding transcriptional LysR family regulator